MYYVQFGIKMTFEILWSIPFFLNFGTQLSELRLLLLYALTSQLANLFSLPETCWCIAVNKNLPTATSICIFLWIKDLSMCKCWLKPTTGRNKNSATPTSILCFHLCSQLLLLDKLFASFYTPLVLRVIISPDPSQI